MLSQKYSQACDHFEQISRLIQNSHHWREYGFPYSYHEEITWHRNVDSVFWRAYDYCGAFTRLYSTFERLVLDISDQWIAWCIKNKPSVILQSGASLVQYEMGVSEILKRKNENRFADINRGDILSGLDMFYNTPIQPTKGLLTAPFFATLPNLRISHIIQLFKSIELGDPSAWLAKSAKLAALRREEGINYEEGIKDFVERRNEAAHGNGLPRQIYGHNEIMLRLQLITALCEALFEYVLASMCHTALGPQISAKAAGFVSSVWPKHGAFELTTTGVEISENDQILFLSDSGCVRAAVESIQLNGSGITRFSGHPGTQLGICSTSLPKKDVTVLSVSSVIGLSEMLAHR